VVCADEVELIPWQNIQQMFSMAKSDPRTGKLGQQIFASTRKTLVGSMQKLLDRHVHDPSFFKLYSWCAFEAVENCKLPSCEGCKTKTRTLVDENGARLESFYDRCIWRDAEGRVKHSRAPEDAHQVEQATGLVMKAKLADGFLLLSDVWRKFQQLDAETWDAEWEGLRPGRTGLVYKAFDEAIHVVPGLGYQPDLPVLAGCDYGFAAPFATVFGQFRPAANPPRNRVQPSFDLFLFDELYGEEQSFTAHWLPEMLARHAQYDVGLWFCDPSAAGMINDMRLAGLRALGINQGDRAIKLMQDLLIGHLHGGGRVYVSDRLAAFLSEIIRYRYRKATVANDPTEKPVKRDDHIMDALKYFLSGMLWWMKSQATTADNVTPASGGPESRLRARLRTSLPQGPTGRVQPMGPGRGRALPVLPAVAGYGGPR
jgi:hypothetical protein